jgi:DNA polymerase
MFIGEAPGQNEDIEGKPFVGQAGKLLTEMIKAIGLSRNSVYITNIIKCRAPNDRDPKTEEINTCNQYIQQQIKLVKPKIILTVGRVAAQALLKTNKPLSKLRGVSHQLADIPLAVVYHPSYLLRSLLEKRKAWQDLQLANNLYQKTK